MHNLDFTKGRAAIAYAGETPWHGYGEIILPTDSLEDIRRKAGLDYEVIERPVFYGVENAEGKRIPITIKERKALLRGDSQDFLSIVGSDYHVHQPAAILGFFKDILGQKGISVDVAGALDGGKKVWALGKLDDSFTLYGRDTIVPYVLAASSYDLSLSSTFMLTGTRVVCENTLRFSGAFTADGKSDDVYKVRHDRALNVTEAHGKLGLNKEAWEQHKRQVENLARFQVSPDEILEYFYNVAGQGDDIVRNEDNGEIISFPEPGRVVKHFVQAYHNGPGADLPSAKGTLWGAVNAVTFYQDHVAPAADRGKRFSSATFGGGNVRKQHAFDLALEKFAEAA